MHPYRKEVELTINTLSSHGMRFRGFDDGERYTTTDLNTIIDGILSVDESSVYYTYNGFDGVLLFVLGNEPGMAVADYSFDDESGVGLLIDVMLDEIYQELN